MSIRPIDLQTMFMRLNDLSREQSIAQNAAAQRQAAMDAQAAKLAKENEEKVTGLEEVQEGPEKIHDEQEHESGGDAGTGPGTKKEAGSEESAPAAVKSGEPEVIKDPDLGSRIDISG